MIRYVTPYALDGNLARAMNLEMELGGADYIAFMDRDIWFPHPHFGHQIERIVAQHGKAVYTCYTNRVNCPWQRIDFKGSDKDAEQFARELYDTNISRVEDHTASQLMSGFLIIFPVDKWLNLPESSTLLGVDNMIHEMARLINLKVLLMTGVFCWHYYSGWDGKSGHQKRDKSHLKI